MKNLLFFWSILICSALFAESQPLCYSHSDLKQFSLHGNYQKSLCSKAMGAKQFEVWRASLSIGSKTPKHVHETEEVFIVLKGKIRAIIGDEEVICEAPATLICPANTPHQLINIGEEPTDQILVLGLDSKIYNAEGEEMQLPWRK
ncbi:MAG: cupin domain-containing protein [Chlamydiae bacterium]|nr:cupin domain-containing protein [Chlamydiota bacterium]